MNFFGHCVVSSWRSADPSFALGSMLPDLAHIIGQRHIGSSHPAIAEGIGFHHETDAAFHQGESFLRLQRKARRALKRGGVRRGPTLAVAHVGVELILDAELARSDTYRAHYGHALSSAGQAELHRSLEFGAGGDQARSAFDALVQRLTAHQAQLAPKTPAQLFERLERILAGRPNLALSPEDRPAVVDWAEQAFGDVATQLPHWEQQLRRALRLPFDTTPATFAVPPSPST